MLPMLMQELEYLKYWLTQQEIQQVFAKGNNFMFKYLTFCMQLLKSQDQERPCMIKNPNTTPIIFKISKKVKGNPSYVTLQDVKLPRASMEKMLKMKVREVKWIAQKRLGFSDIDPSLNRLMIPVERILNEDFLTDDEKAWLDQKEKTEAKLINPWAVEHVLDPKEEEDHEHKVISMSKWKMHHHYYVYALRTMLSKLGHFELSKKMMFKIPLYAQSGTLIKQTCKEIPNYDLCVGYKFRSSHLLAKDLQGLAPSWCSICGRRQSKPEITS
ncbi:hypothetical protein Cgig2_020001 [Carnegiea gigantea]|uniref:Uncharacterized protein n=1 Tax=Carnegiea gigantea TaxID=171969 RepID=A0A9Q1KDT1_9CARY|nr:hypothetical protein Cgig2_020001 [Carnegiea gigantea]